MSKTLSAIALTAGLMLVGCVDHSEDFQPMTPDAVTDHPVPQQVTPATPATTAPAGGPTTAPSR